MDSSSRPSSRTRPFDALLAEAAAIRTPSAAVILQPLGGAVARLGSDTALVGRSAKWALQVMSTWSDPAETEAETAWVADAREALRPCTIPAPWPNFVTDTDEAAVRRAYGDFTYARLQAVKDRWDPRNVFRGSQNVKPSR